MERHYTPIDRCLMQIDRALRTACASPSDATRPYPGAEVGEAEMTTEERSNAAALMRVNHAGEVCAQALYSGQALGARDSGARARLESAAEEETDHLSWCARRLKELDSRPSYLDPFWYAGSFALGTLAGLAGDRWSLGFVVETERQVEAHLGDHLNRLPLRDLRSRAVVTTMQADEARHGESARAAGGRELPWPVPGLMRRCAGVMKFVAYRV